MQRIEYDIEKFLRDEKYIQTYDGQTALHKATEQFGLLPEERRFFVRKYRKVINNRYTRDCVKLIYDLRKGQCDFIRYQIPSNGIPRESRTTSLATNQKT